MDKSRLSKMIHGTANKARNQQPSMFDILSWNAQSQRQRHQKYYINHNYQVSNRKQTNDQIQNPLNYQQNYINYQTQNTSAKVDMKHPKKIHHELYMYQDDQQRQTKRLNEKEKLIKRQKQKSMKQLRLKSRSTAKSLDPNNQNDKEQIKKRKKKIKQFNLYTRQLPDSAFTTYYGKPAFGSYGTGNTSQQKKTFNVMPHAGMNHPKFNQTYKSALSKGKQIKQTHLPKKPIQNLKQQKQDNQNNEYYNIPIKKPDLINTVRFTQKKNEIHKQRTPTHNQLNWLPPRQPYCKAPLKKSSKVLKKTTSCAHIQPVQQYPQINKRDHLNEILSQKKRQQTRLAYKVTEVYPLNHDDVSKENQSTKISQWTQMKPAGIQSPRSYHVSDVFTHYK